MLGPPNKFDFEPRSGWDYLKMGCGVVISLFGVRNFENNLLSGGNRMKKATRVCVIVAAVLMVTCLRGTWASEQRSTPKEDRKAAKVAAKAARKAEKTAQREHRTIERERQKQQMAREKQALQRLREDIRDKKGTELYENVALFAVGMLLGIVIGRFWPPIRKWW